MTTYKVLETDGSARMGHDAWVYYAITRGWC